MTTIYQSFEEVEQGCVIGFHSICSKKLPIIHMYIFQLFLCMFQIEISKWNSIEIKLNLQYTPLNQCNYRTNGHLIPFI